MRPDLADVRLAAQVFAPHYAAPIAMRATAATPILASPSAAAAALATLATGEIFEVLEMTSAYCWGQSRGSALVGYVARDVLEQTPPEQENAA